MLGRTSIQPQCLYHGHVRSWKELTNDMKSALRRAGLTDHNGNILTK